MTTSQSRNARKRNLPNQTQHALRPAKPQNPPPPSRKQPRSLSAYASPQKNERNEVAHAPPRSASNSKSRASAEIVGNLRYPGKPVAQIALKNIEPEVDLANRMATYRNT